MVSERRTVQAIEYPKKIMNEVFLGTFAQSSYLDPNDKMFYALVALMENSYSPSSSIMYTYKTIVDINGDGLNDILYHVYNYNQFAVFLNNGGMGFDIVYRCRRHQSPLLYEGDCADPDRPL